MSTAPTRTPPPAAPPHDAESEKREFVVGTTGWSADDLDDPEIERKWDQGSYEIVEGVLTHVAAANFDGGGALVNLVALLKNHVDAAGLRGMFAVETDVILESMRVPRVDAVYLSGDALARQEALNAARPRRRGKYGRVRVPPTLAIEAVSPGHETHDRKTKRRWYAEAGVPHYWLLDAYEKTLECLILEGGVYRTAQLARDTDDVHSTLFPGLVIPLRRVWM
jgi:Uma2 family endonuclease